MKQVNLKADVGTELILNTTTITNTTVVSTSAFFIPEGTAEVRYFVEKTLGDIQLSAVKVADNSSMTGALTLDVDQIDKSLAETQVSLTNKKGYGFTFSNPKSGKGWVKIDFLPIDVASAGVNLKLTVVALSLPLEKVQR